MLEALRIRTMMGSVAIVKEGDGYHIYDSDISYNVTGAGINISINNMSLDYNTSLLEAYFGQAVEITEFTELTKIIDQPRFMVTGGKVGDIDLKNIRNKLFDNYLELDRLHRYLVKLLRRLNAQSDTILLTLNTKDLSVKKYTRVQQGGVNPSRLEIAIYALLQRAYLRGGIEYITSYNDIFEQLWLYDCDDKAYRTMILSGDGITVV